VNLCVDCGPVSKVKHGEAIRQGMVYVIPSGYHASVQLGVFQMQRNEHDRVDTINVLFQSLAANFGHRSLVVMFSGQWHDGERGLAAISTAGGFIMMKSSIAMGVVDDKGHRHSSVNSSCAVDFAGSPCEIADWLLNIVTMPLGGDSDIQKVAENELTRAEDLCVLKLFACLEANTGVPFHHYDEALFPRIAHCMILSGCPTVQQYTENVVESKVDVDVLFDKLLMGTTGFFQCKQDYSQLEKVLQALIHAKVVDQQNLRIWVAGCSTGEEAYSIAMIIQDHLDQHGLKDLNVRIMASDVRKKSLQIAENGVYNEQKVRSQVKPEFLRFFERKGRMLAVKHYLRCKVMFIEHNLLSNQFFTDIDLIACRGTLHNFKRSSLQKIHVQFSKCLHPEGYLWMSPGDANPSQLFARVKVPKIAGSQIPKFLHPCMYKLASEASEVSSRNGSACELSLSNSMADGEANISESHSVICPMPTLHIRPEQQDNLSIEMAIDTDPIIFVNNDRHVLKTFGQLLPYLSPEMVPNVIKDGITNCTLDSILAVPLRKVLRDEMEALGEAPENGVQTALVAVQDSSGNSVRHVYMTIQPMRRSATGLSEIVQSWAVQIHMIPKETSMLISPYQLSVQHVYHVLVVGFASEICLYLSSTFTLEQCVMCTLALLVVVLGMSLSQMHTASTVGAHFPSTTVDRDAAEWSELLQQEKLNATLLLNKEVEKNVVLRAQLGELHDAYQVTSEEHQTLTEELKSTNEELLLINEDHRKRISQVTRLHEELTNLLASTDSCVLFLDKTGVIQNMTTSMEQIGNMISHDKGRNISMFAGGNEFISAIERFRKDLLAAVQEGQEDLDTTRHAYRGESTYLLRALEYKRGSQLHDEGHEQFRSGMVITAVDVTELVAAKRGADAIAAELRAIINTANAPIFGITKDGLINEWNDKAAVITGFSREEVMGRDLILDFITEEHRDAVRDVFESALRGMQTADFEFPLFTKDGEVLDILLNTTPRRDETGDIVGVVSVGQDITAKKVALVASAQAQSMQTTLAATSHDLRTPVQSIMHASGILLAESSEEDRKDDGMLKILASSCQLLLMYTENVLDVQRIQVNSMLPEDPAPVDLALELQCMVDCIAGSALKKPGVRMLTQIDSACPTVRCPTSHFIRAVMNPLTNAMKYTNEGHVKLTFDWHADTDTEVHCRVVISDTGVGIKKDQVMHICELFHTSKMTHDSMGIGMFVCKNVIQRLNGTVNIESIPGEGTSIIIKVVLPIWNLKEPQGASLVHQEAAAPVASNATTVEPLPPNPLAPARMSKASSATDLSGMDQAVVQKNNHVPTVLLVDDTVMNNTLGKKMLTKLGCSVTQAFDGLEALNKMKEQEFSLVLMDISMPVMDGKESVRQYRAWEQENRPGCRQKIYAYTGNCNPTDQTEYSRVGCDGCVPRPCKPARFRELAFGN